MAHSQPHSRPARPLVALGMLGTQLDLGSTNKRWEKWRPTVGLCQQPDMLVSRLELLTGSKWTDLRKQVSADIAQVSPETKVVPHTMDIRDPWDFEEAYAALLAFAAKYPFDPDREDYVVHITTGTHVIQICLFLLVESRRIPARLVQTSPPHRSSDPAGTAKIIDLDLTKYASLASRFAREHRDAINTLKSGIRTRNKAFNRTIQDIEHVAANAIDPMLLLGPTGAGKSQLAKRIYELKHARHLAMGPFIEVNCATLRGDSAMSTLFGHRKGAYTGAASDRAGLLKAADKGVLFLDEVGELGLDEQAMLLRALEEKRFLPLGSDEETQSDFQLIAGTNRDLYIDARAGRFREDLLARINLWTFRLPALRDRREDIAPNIEYELDQYAARTGKSVRFTTEASEQYLAFAQTPQATWAGNFRDLSASVTRLATLAEGGRITPTIVDHEITRLNAAWHASQLDSSLATSQVSSADSADTAILTRAMGTRAQSIDRFDAVQLAEVLRVCTRARTLSEAGRELFAISRTTKASVNDADRLRKYLAKFGLEFERVRGA